MALLYIEPPFHHVWFAKLSPGGFAIPHIDAGNPYYERWHIPVFPAGWFYEEGMYMKAPDTPFRVHHWKSHAIWNDTLVDRVHLIVDRKVIPPEAPKGGRLIYTDMIPEVAALIP